MQNSVPLNYPSTYCFSPNGRYVAVLGSPQEVWGNQLAALAVWEATAPQLLYYRAGYQAHALAPGAAPPFCYWSPGGDWLVFYEVKRQQTYEVVWLHLPAGQLYRTAATSDLLSQLIELIRNEAGIQSLLQAAQASSYPLPTPAAVPSELRWPPANKR